MTVAELKERYGLKTGDEIEPPPPVRPDPPKRSEPWSDARVELWRKWRPAALYVVGTKWPTGRYAGDNRGGWPIRFGVTENYEDKLTSHYDPHSPYTPVALWLRIWTPSQGHAKQLIARTVEVMTRRNVATQMSDTLDEWIERWGGAEPARYSWLEIGPEFDLPIADDLGLAPLKANATKEERQERRFRVVSRKLERAILKLAENNVIETWEHRAVVPMLEEMERKAAVRTAGGAIPKRRSASRDRSVSSLSKRVRPVPELPAKPQITLEAGDPRRAAWLRHDLNDSAKAEHARWVARSRTPYTAEADWPPESPEVEDISGLWRIPWGTPEHAAHLAAWRRTGQDGADKAMAADVSKRALLEGRRWPEVNADRT